MTHDTSHDIDMMNCTKMQLHLFNLYVSCMDIFYNYHNAVCHMTSIYSTTHQVMSINSSFYFWTPYQTSHFLVGFILDPEGHLYCSANSFELDNVPITLKRHLEFEIIQFAIITKGCSRIKYLRGVGGKQTFLCGWLNVFNTGGGVYHNFLFFIGGWCV